MLEKYSVYVKSIASNNPADLPLLQDLAAQEVGIPRLLAHRTTRSDDRGSARRRLISLWLGCITARTPVGTPSELLKSGCEVPLTLALTVIGRR
eukprot:scaffold48_cov311-Pinguiococcus_pyrenoidosus.AAC.145